MQESRNRRKRRHRSRTEHKEPKVPLKFFVSIPSYKTKQVDEQGKPIYQDVCYPVTKDFREKLYNEIILII
nr:septation protein SpoVG family protein [Jutongia hominis]